MMVSMDRAGRVVIPKEARERLSLEPDTQLELVVTGEAIQLAPIRRASRTFSVRDGFATIDPVDGMSITDADVQNWRDADQR